MLSAPRNWLQAKYLPILNRAYHRRAVTSCPPGSKVRSSSSRLPSLARSSSSTSSELEARLVSSVGLPPFPSSSFLPLLSLSAPPCLSHASNANIRSTPDTATAVPGPARSPRSLSHSVNASPPSAAAAAEKRPARLAGLARCSLH